MEKAEEEERARESAFDWWLILKILIVLAIIFLLVLIAIGNAKRR
jgi:hypothetical protein